MLSAYTCFSPLTSMPPCRTVEYYPAKGDGTPIGLNILTTTLPANLFALVWYAKADFQHHFCFTADAMRSFLLRLLPSGRLFINANLGTELFDWKTSTEYQLDDIPHSVRTYPGSAATAMMPLSELTTSLNLFPLPRG